MGQLHSWLLSSDAYGIFHASLDYLTKFLSSTKNRLSPYCFVWYERKTNPFAIVWRRDLLMWSWRESNPRPHKETIRFLHAYSRLWFSSIDKTWTTNRYLILWISSCCRGSTRLFPIYLHRWTLRFGTTSLERCLVPSPCDGIKPVIYYASIRQRERSFFRQLIFCSLRLRR